MGIVTIGIILVLCFRPLHHLFVRSMGAGAGGGKDAVVENDDDTFGFGSKHFESGKAMKNIENICRQNGNGNGNSDDDDERKKKDKQQENDHQQDQTCDCYNPMIAREGTYPGWQSAHEANIDLIDKRQSTRHGSDPLDVVFFGDSITEEWNGRWFGTNESRFDEINTVWRELFDSHNATIKGLALGIAGDHIANLLYRIQNGELKNADSKVFWLLIGTNDLTVRCSEEVVLLGIVHVVEEIRKARPGSIVVVNGLLPRTSRMDGRLSGGEVEIDVGIDGDVDVDADADDDTGDGIEFENEQDASSRSGSEDVGIVETSDGSDLETSKITTSSTPTTPTTTTTTKTERNITPIHDYWQSIQSINKGLERYAEQNNMVEYFEGSPIFIAQMGNQFYHRDEKYLMKELQGDYLHPTALGHRLWGEAIVDYLVSDLDTPTNLRKGFAV